MKNLLCALVPESRFLYRLCRAYVDRFNGENNVNMESNGELRLMRKFLPIAGVVFDIGANVGDWATLALEINPRIRLHCFEPGAETFEALRRRGFPDTVVYNNFACGAGIGSATLYSFAGVSAMNSLYQRSGLEYVGLNSAEPAGVIAVESVDGYCERYSISRIDYAKIDVEGHELKVIEGMAKTIAEGKVGLIQLEYGGTYIDSRILLRDIWNLILDLNPGYRFYKLHSDGPRLVPRYSQSMENFQYQNWAAILGGVEG